MQELTILFTERIEWAENRDSRNTKEKNSFYVKPPEYDEIADLLSRKNNTVLLIAEKGWGKTELANAVYRSSLDAVNPVFLVDPISDKLYSENLYKYIKEITGEEVLKKEYHKLLKCEHDLVAGGYRIGSDSTREDIQQIKAILSEESANLTYSEAVILLRRCSDGKIQELSPQFLIYDFTDNLALNRSRFFERIVKIYEYHREHYDHCSSLLLCLPNVYDAYAMDKFITIRAKNYSTDQLIEIYTKRWGNTDPFTPDALELLADISGGLPRQFLCNISLCLKQFRLVKTITKSMAQETKGKAEDRAEGLMLETFPRSIINSEVAKAMLESFRLSGSCRADLAQKLFLQKKGSNTANIPVTLTRFYGKLEKAGLIDLVRGGPGGKINEILPTSRLKNYL